MNASPTRELGNGDRGASSICSCSSSRVSAGERYGVGVESNKLCTHTHKSEESQLVRWFAGSLVGLTHRHLMNLVGIRIKGAQRFVASIELLGSFARRNNAFFILVVLVVIVVIILLIIIIVSTSLRSSVSRSSIIKKGGR